MSKQESQFRVGDKVIWTSGGQGTMLTKTGVVVAVVKPKHDPPFAKFRKSHTSHYGGGPSRAHTSYLVEVDVGPRAKPALYWPRVSALSPAE